MSLFVHSEKGGKVPFFFLSFKGWQWKCASVCSSDSRRCWCFLWAGSPGSTNLKWNVDVHLFLASVLCRQTKWVEEVLWKLCLCVLTGLRLGSCLRTSSEGDKAFFNCQWSLHSHASAHGTVLTTQCLHTALQKQPLQLAPIPHQYSSHTILCCAFPWISKRLKYFSLETPCDTCGSSPCFRPAYLFLL